MTFEATYLGSNGWFIKYKNINLIIDPWLKGDLIFPPGEWFFKGSLDKEITIHKDIDKHGITNLIGGRNLFAAPSIKDGAKITEDKNLNFLCVKASNSRPKNKPVLRRVFCTFTDSKSFILVLSDFG